MGGATHAARPWLGQNTFEMLTRDYMALKSIFTENRDDYWHKTMVLTKCAAGNGSTNIVQGKEPMFFGFEHGASDARYLSNRNIPDAIWGAEGGMSQHTEEEHIVLDSF